MSRSLARKAFGDEGGGAKPISIQLFGNDLEMTALVISDRIHYKVVRAQYVYDGKVEERAIYYSVNEFGDPTASFFYRLPHVLTDTRYGVQLAAIAVAYDITGVYDDYERLWPVEYLGKAITDYLHNGKTVHVSSAFKDWCDFLGVTEAFALDIIWGVTTFDIIMNDYERGMDFVETAYSEWVAHQHEFQELIRLLLQSRAFVIPQHSGINEMIAEAQKLCGEAGESQVF